VTLPCGATAGTFELNLIDIPDNVGAVAKRTAGWNVTEAQVTIESTGSLQPLKDHWSPTDKLGCLWFRCANDAAPLFNTIHSLRELHVSDRR
jgi:hypothetical protein